MAVWTPEWAAKYAEAKEIMVGIFGRELIRIHHIGSTSVPCIGYAKPIIDILIEVRDIESVLSFNEAMQQEGFIPKGENGIVGRRYFTKGGDERTHHVHIFEAGHPSAATHLDFKAYMMEHPQDAAAYGQLKLRLAKQFPESVLQYQEGKQSMLESLVQKAAIWGAEQRQSGNI